MKFKVVEKDEFDKLTKKSDSILIDVREEYEFEERNIGGKNIPMAEVLNNIEKLVKYNQILLCCKSGKRSKAIAFHLQNKFPDKAIFSLENGIDGYLIQ